MSVEILKLQKLAKKCLRNEPAYCQNACPLSFDVKKFLKKIQDNSLDAAYKFYKNTVLFPQIVSSICDAPCKNKCIRNSFGGSIDIKKIEKACCIYAKAESSHKYYIPTKKQKIIVIGGGLSGMGCAMKLSKRGYSVEVYEKDSNLGGKLWKQLTDDFTQVVLESELQTLFTQDRIEVFTEYEIKTLEKLEYDAVYVATGYGGYIFDLKTDFGQNSLATNRKGVFLNKIDAEEESSIEALRRGILAADEIEFFLKVGCVKVQNSISEKKTSRLKMPLNKVNVCAPKVHDENHLFSREEAVEEAYRCLLCGCNECIDSCEMLAKYKKYPEKVVEDINATLNVMEGYTVRIASRQINSCNLCGSCAQKCPENFDFEELFLESRRQMHKAGDIPPAYHDFWIRDMEHALSKNACSILKKKEHCKYLFFPGCQLGASDPEYVVKAYTYLEKHLNNVGIMLSCCGAPAYWAGDQTHFEKIMDNLEEQWKKAGRPEMILACPHCGKLLAKYFKGCRFRFIYEIMDFYGLENITFDKSSYTVFDPCASREFKHLQDSIRHIITSYKGELEELAQNREETQCCGYGGNIYAVDKFLMDNIVKNRIEGSPKDYITYCTNCRDTFASKGKRSCHVLDFLLLAEGYSLESRMKRKVPNLSQRRRNREETRKKMETYFGIENHMEKKEKINLYIDDMLLDKMDKELILKEDAQDVIELCENEKCKLLNKQTGNYIAHLKIGYMTYWVEYKKEKNGFRLINIYCHRMSIQED